MKIVISTGIYPPEVGGLSQYAYELKSAFEKKGHTVTVSTYGNLKKIPTGFRHVLYFFSVLKKLFGKDCVIILDTFSVGLPAVCAARILRVPSIMRIGGDFLWELYVERTKDLVPLVSFYETTRSAWSYKEKIIYQLTKYALNKTTKIIFSTSWQKNIFDTAYQIAHKNAALIENYYGGVRSANTFQIKNFIASTRPLALKNVTTLETVFAEVEKQHADIRLVTTLFSHDEFVRVLQTAYAVILVSISDISPNMVLDALRTGTPVICTKETGILDRIKDSVYLVDPRNPAEIKKALEDFCDESIRNTYAKKAASFNFTHTWDEIADEFIHVYRSL
jgi:glycosyltransferase involved in cell wall biosynthesis